MLPMTFSIIFKDYFETCDSEFETDFKKRFNFEFGKAAWKTTIIRWQLVSMCLSAGFPRLIIYESLNVLFGLPLDSNLSLEWIYENIHLGPWLIDI